MSFAARMRQIAPSPTLKVTAEADRMRRLGIDVVDLGAGEPDFPTPEHVKAAARLAIDQNFTKYTPPAGMPDLKQAICARYKTDYGVSFTEAECIVTAGGKQALYNTALSLFGPGDEVITHAPFWPTRRRCSRGPTPRTASSCTRPRSSTRSPRARAGSSSTRRATPPAR